RVAPGPARASLRVRAALTIANAEGVRHVGNVRTGGDYGDRSIAVIASFNPGDSPVGGQVMLNRESLDARRADRTAAALPHLFIVVEDVDHRARVSPCTTERRVRAAIRVDRGEDVVSVASGAHGIVVSPENFTGPTGGSVTTGRSAAVAQTAGLCRAHEHCC